MADLPCSFCSRPVAEVLCMVAADRARICDECVGRCSELVVAHLETRRVERLVESQHAALLAMCAPPGAPAGRFRSLVFWRTP